MRHSSIMTVILVGYVGAAEAQTEPTEPIRAQRKVAVAGELGWNSLAGLGVNLIYHVNPHLSADLGAGLSGVGLKAGLRLRANFLLSNWTPFLGAGILYGSGTIRWGGGKRIRR